MSDIAELLETDEKAQNSSLENSSDEIPADSSDGISSAEIPADSSDEQKDEVIAGFLSLDLVKDYCRIIGGADDEILKLLISSARADFESYTQRNLDDFGGEIPANVIKWGLAVVADAFENRGVFKKDLFFAIERYRRSPLRLEIDEKDKLKAQLLAQKNLINELMAKVEFSQKTEQNSAEPNLNSISSKIPSKIPSLRGMSEANDEAISSKNPSLSEIASALTEPRNDGQPSEIASALTEPRNDDDGAENSAPAENSSATEPKEQTEPENSAPNLNSKASAEPKDSNDEII